MEVKHLIKLYKILKKENIKIGEKLEDYTSFKIGGRAKIMLLPQNLKMAKKTLKFLTKKQIKFVVLGAGTNVLISGDIDVVVCMKNLNKINIKGEKAYAESGVKLFKLNEVLKDNSLSGLEKTYGIPGSVGGGIVQNCGAYGFSVSDCLLKVVLFDGKKVKCVKKENLFFDYRTSEFKKNKNLIVLAGIFKLTKAFENEIEAKLDEIFSARKEKQPYEYPSAGSVFKRVNGVIISKLIDEMGFKGFKVGGAMVSEKHAGFIINYDHATYDDVIMLIKYIKNKIKLEKNIDLELEIELL